MKRLILIFVTTFFIAVPIITLIFGASTASNGTDARALSCVYALSSDHTRRC
jgi:hypothetical protein